MYRAGGCPLRRRLQMARGEGHEYGIHEVTGSIPVSSTKPSNNLGTRPGAGAPGSRLCVTFVSLCAEHRGTPRDIGDANMRRE
jgi:hypothetical protein